MRPCVGHHHNELKSRYNRSKSDGLVTTHHRPRAWVVGSRPSGCPHRYCGCALSLKLFGRIIPRLNLAVNWLAFPRALPSGGMVAARHGHVFLLKEHISGSTWLAWDPNSGRGRIRLHARSIAGFRIVDPRGSRMAWQ
jgi:hypothetical protein